MNATLKPIAEQVIVITGASSGIGLATAKQAARQGAKLVLAARNEEALKIIVQSVKHQKGRAVYVVADVGKREDVQRIADTAIAEFGRIDSWVNNAGVGIWGRLDTVSDDDHKRLFDTNFWGLVYGSLIAAPYLAKQGGALINLGSIASDLAFPLQGMYCASKHAIKAFTDSLRSELRKDGAPVSVTLIKPAAIGTPFTEHAANYTDKLPELPNPIYRPEEVAHAILYAAMCPKRDIYIGGGGKMMATLGQRVPMLFDWIAERFLFRAQLRDLRGAELSERHSGSLHRAGKDGQTRGYHPGKWAMPSLYTRAVLHPVAAAACVLGGVAAVKYLLRSKKEREMVQVY